MRITLLFFLCVFAVKLNAQIYIPDEPESLPTQLVKLEPQLYVWAPSLEQAGAAFVYKQGDSLIIWGGLLHDEENQRFVNALKTVFPSAGLSAFIFNGPTVEAHLLAAFLNRVYKISRFWSATNHQSYWQQYGANQFSNYLAAGGRLFNFSNTQFETINISKKTILKINNTVIELWPQRGGPYGCGLSVFVPQWRSFFAGYLFNNMLFATNFGTDFNLWLTDLKELQKANPSRIIGGLKGEVFNMYQLNYFSEKLFIFINDAQLQIKKGMAVDQFIDLAGEYIGDLHIKDYSITLPLLYTQLKTNGK